MTSICCMLFDLKLQIVPKKRWGGECFQYPGIIKSVLESMEAISESCWKLLKHPDTALGPLFGEASELFRMNHCLLNCIGVSHPMLDRVVTLASSCGLAAKLTGAGGGGCALLLLDVGSSGVSNPAIQEELLAEGFQCWEVELGCTGAMLH